MLCALPEIPIPHFYVAESSFCLGLASHPPAAVFPDPHASLTPVVSLMSTLWGPL